MTRVDKIAEYLGGILPTLNQVVLLEMATQIMRIADDRDLATLADFSELIQRSPTTIKSWIEHNRMDVPAPAYTVRNGPLWDMDDLRGWVLQHPAEVRH